MNGYSRKVGARLRSLRKQRGLTLQQVEVLSNKRLKGSLLAAYRARRPQHLGHPARPDRTPSTACRSTSCFRKRRKRCWSLRSRPSSPSICTSSKVCPNGKDPFWPDTSARLQQQRHDFNTAVVTLRGDDLEQLAAAYKTSPEMLRRSLQEWGVFKQGQPPPSRPEVEHERRTDEPEVSTS